MPASAQTVSVSRGKTAIEHDLREYTPNNVDPSMSIYNAVLINELGGKTLAEYTNEYMKSYIEEYNAKQRRSDRMKSYDYAADYIEEQNNMQKSRQNYIAGQLAYEYVIQFGDHQTMDVNEVIKKPKLRKEVHAMFEEFIQSYQSSYPHMRIILATVHMDEPMGTPHMHILVQPIGEGYKQGLSHQVSLTKALACDGFERSEKKGDRLSMTRWQDDIKDNIMEPILKRHKYTRAYKDGEKQHLPVALYKRAMGEKDAIVEEAKVEAEQIVEKAREEVEELEEEKDYLINGNGKDSAYDMPFEDWSIADLKCEKDFLINGDPDFSGDIFRGVSELEEKHSELRADIKDLEQAKEEKTTEVASIEDKYSKMWDEYEALRDGYKDKDGRHILGYNELVQRHKELLQDPARLLETEEGQQVLEEAKEEIVETVQKNLISNMLGFIKREIFDTLKEWLVEPIYDAIDEMMRGHYFKLNDSDKRILTGAIDRTVDGLVDKLDIGSKIEENVCENMPSENQIEQEVQRIYRGRGR